jgi:hypothetical protein
VLRETPGAAGASAALAQAAAGPRRCISDPGEARGLIAVLGGSEVEFPKTTIGLPQDPQRQLVATEDVWWRRRPPPGVPKSCGTSDRFRLIFAHSPETKLMSRKDLFPGSVRGAFTRIRCVVVRKNAKARARLMLCGPR